MSRDLKMKLGSTQKLAFDIAGRPKKTGWGGTGEKVAWGTAGVGKGGYLCE